MSMVLEAVVDFIKEIEHLFTEMVLFDEKKPALCPVEIVEINN